MLFESICNSQWFIHTSIILFLNKIDLFKEKLPTSPVRKYFPDYIGDPKSYKHASQYFEESFKRLNRNSAKVRALIVCPSPNPPPPADPHTHTLPLVVKLLRLVNPAGHIRSFYKCHRYKSAQDHHDERPGHDSSKKPTSFGTIDIPEKSCSN